MAEITIDRDAFEKLDAGVHNIVAGEERVAQFLANKFREGEKDASRDDPNWVYNFWTWNF